MCVHVQSRLLYVWRCIWNQGGFHDCSRNISDVRRNDRDMVRAHATHELSVFLLYVHMYGYTDDRPFKLRAGTFLSSYLHAFYVCVSAMCACVRVCVCACARAHLLHALASHGNPLPFINRWSWLIQHSCHAMPTIGILLGLC